LPKYCNVKSIAERDNVIAKWVNSFGEYKVGKDSFINEGPIKISPDIDWITNSNLNPQLVKLLIGIKKAQRTKKSYYIDLYPGVGNPMFKNEKSYTDMKFPDAGYRLLALYRYWNIIQYFFPYKNLIEEDWKNVLEEFIPRFINASNEPEYKLAMLGLIARVHDTHANIWMRDSVLEKFRGVNYTPIKVQFIENKVVVTDYVDDELGMKTGLLKGDVISKIGNRNIQEIIRSKLNYTPASNYPTQLRDIARDLLRTNDSILKVEYIHNGETKFTELRAYSTDDVNIYKKYQNQDTCFKFITPRIGYLYLGSIKSSYLPQIMENLKNTKGLIIDLRCYPSEFVVFSLGEYLVPESTPFVKFAKGSIQSPGLFTFTDNLTIGNDNTKEKYAGKIVIMINEMTQSQAEYTTMAFRVAPKATVIGSTTAGADGNVSQFFLPGGIRTMISGIGVYYPDGKETQRIGIIPDIEAKPTIEGIKQGKDEVLEKAIQIINGIN
jgi:C-terminal processing protease CtpA/Prc